MSEPDRAPPADPASQPKPRLWDNRFVRRLPLLLVAAVGFFVLLPKVPHEVELDYDLGDLTIGLQSLDLELHDAEGRAQQRTVLTGDAARHPAQRAHLVKGTYRVQARLGYADHVTLREALFTLDDAERLDVKL